MHETNGAGGGWFQQYVSKNNLFKSRQTTKGKTMQVETMIEKLLDSNVKHGDDIVPILIGRDPKPLEAGIVPEYEAVIKKILKDGDTELLKLLAIKFDDYHHFLRLEDVLCDRMGIDEYFDFADTNGLRQ
jgi:hypothetical protein